jgi:hypothetical protein
MALSSLEKKEVRATLVPEGCSVMDLPPIRPKGCGLEFWGGAVAIDRSLRVWDVGQAQGDARAYASPAAVCGDMQPQDRKALAAYMIDLWQRFGAAD